MEATLTSRYSFEVGWYRRTICPAHASDNSDTVTIAAACARVALCYTWLQFAGDRPAKLVRPVPGAPA